MCTRSALLLSTFALLISTGCTSAPADTHDADVKAIKDTDAALNQAFSSRDVDKTAGFYAEDASLLLPNTPVISGRDAIKQALKPVLADANFALQLTPVKVDAAKSGDMAYSQGTYIQTTTDPVTKKPVTDKGKYLAVFKKQADGSWKAVEDTISSNQPLPAPAKTKAKAKTSRTRAKRK